jgi:hypothetical protein
MSLELQHVTANQLRRVVRDSFEDPEPWEAIATVMAADAGKPFTVRHVRLIAALIPGAYANDDDSAPPHQGRVWVQRDTGHGTSEFTYQAAGVPWEDRQSCTVWRDSWSEQIPKLCPTRDEIENLNPARYSARLDRNKQRTALVADLAQLRQLAREMNKARAALLNVSALFKFGEPCQVEQYALQRRWGWEHDKNYL